MTTANKMVTKPLTQQKKSDLRTMNVVADHAQIDLTWAKFGYSGLPIMATNVDGQIAGPSGYKAQWQKSALFPEPKLRCMIPASQPFIPMEAIDEVVTGLEKRIIDTSPEAKQRNFKIEYVKRKPSHNGNTQQWLIQTNQVDKIKNSFAGNNDQMKLGFVIRNGYNTGVALGIDLFSFRLLCQNGAISRGRDFGSTTIRHIGKDPKELLKTFHDGLMLAVDGWIGLMSMYNKMATIKLNENMANHIYKVTQMPTKYLPKYYQLAKPEAIKKNPKIPLVALDTKGRSVTLFENFNDITQPLWRAKDPHEVKVKNDVTGKIEKQMKESASFYTVTCREVALHKAFASIVENKAEFA